MAAYVTQSFRRWVPKTPTSPDQHPRRRRGASTKRGPDVPFAVQVKLLHRGRQFLSTLTRANLGYADPLEKVLRMTYGRSGPRRHALLDSYLRGLPLPSLPSLPTARARSATEVTDEPSISVEQPPALRRDGSGHHIPDLTNATHPPGRPLPASKPEPEPEPEPRQEQEPEPQSEPDPDPVVLKYSEEWHPPPRLLALMHSQAAQQQNFERMGAKLRVKPLFAPPTTNAWGKPLPPSRCRNLRHEWYQHNLKASCPPVPTHEYHDLRDLVTGHRPVPPPVPRRARAPMSTADREHEAHVRTAALILDGPQPGPRYKDVRNGRPHVLTSRLIRRLLSRAVLVQTPLMKVHPSTGEVTFHWDDGRLWDERSPMQEIKRANPRLLDLLFA